MTSTCVCVCIYIYIYMHSLLIYFTMATKRRVKAASQLFLKFGAAATRRRNATVLEPDFSHYT